MAYEVRWRKGGVAYEMPAMIANLAHTMGFMVHFNCKSGKDRTGIMDVESKFLVQQIHETGQVPDYQNKLDFGSDEKEAYKRLLFESGSLEIHKINTGVSGYKVVPFKPLELKLKTRLGKFLRLAQGLKQFTDVEQTYKDSVPKRLKKWFKSKLSWH